MDMWMGGIYKWVDGWICGWVDGCIVHTDILHHLLVFTIRSNEYIASVVCMCYLFVFMYLFIFIL